MQIYLPRGLKRPAFDGRTIIGLLFLCVPLAVFAQNTLLVLISLAAFAIIWARAIKSPFRCIIATYVSFQWLQATMQVWLAELYRVDLTIPQKLLICSSCRPLQFLVVNTSTEQTVILALAGIVMLSIGARFLEPRVEAFNSVLSALSEFSAARLFIGYLILLAVDVSSGYFIGGGLAGPLVAFGAFKYAFAALLTYLWVTTGRGLYFLNGVVAIEVVVGLTGFFANFKVVFIVMGVACLTVASSHWRRVSRALLVFVPLLILLGSIWTAIKPDYRVALSQGGRTQAIVIDVDQRLSTLTDMLSALDTNRILDGLLGTAARISYIEIPSYVIERVPESRPYEYGALWAETIYHVFMPRFLFPDKAILPSDSERTSRFTGKWYDATASSISMGYITESYIDFGILGVLLIPFMLGLLYALIARNILALGQGDPVFGTVAVLVTLLPVQVFEMSNIKLLPTELWNWIIAALVVWLVWPPFRKFFCLPAALRPMPQQSAIGQ
jgi:hypothetical protein